MTRHGTPPGDWEFFAYVTGLLGDLLPVVSNPAAVISPQSKMKTLGKTPSGYNKHRQVTGISKWTDFIATPAHIERWMSEEDYGTCLQTRQIRALDIDVPDHQQAEEIHAYISSWYDLPRRVRSSSAKFLCAFALPGVYPKRSFKTQHGIVEFLGTGNQFVISGAHIDKDGVSRSRYEWADGLPAAFPELTPEQFEELWAGLVEQFAIEAPSIGKVGSKQLPDIHDNDPVAAYLIEHDWVKSAARDGSLHITCPFASEHTSESAESSTTYFPAHTGGYAQGHFKCLHAHCQGRSDEEFKITIGAPSVLDGFEDLAEQVEAEKKTPEAEKKTYKFVAVPAHEFVEGKSPDWIIKNVLPRADYGIMYGDASAGKTFAVLDMAVSIALGEDWRHHKVEQGTVVFVTAEGAAGMRKRMRAVAIDRGLDLSELPIYFITTAPNLTLSDDAQEIGKAVLRVGGASLIVVDTLSQTTTGANENSGEEMGRVLGHCKGIRHATGAMILLLHHSGKDGTKGARGWSGLRGNADAEYEVASDGERRELTVTKLKDGNFPLHFGFELAPIGIGVDEDDEIIESCVVRHRDDFKPVAKIAPDSALTGTAMEVLRELDSSEESVAGIRITDFIDSIQNRMPHDPEVRDNRRARALKVLEKLQATACVAVEKDRIFLLRG